jgi:Domain of unknown function (DUF6456)
MHLQSLPVPLSADTSELLTRLGRPGAHLSRKEGCVSWGGASVGSRQAINVSALLVAEAAGYVVWAASLDAQSTGTLSSLGRRTLRSHLMTETAIGGQGARQHRRQRSMAEVDAGITAGSIAQGRCHARTVIEQLARRRAGGLPLLTETQVFAARRFAADFERAGLQPRVTARWSAAAVGPPRRRSAPDALPDIAPAISDAQERVRRALASLAASLGNLILDVCGFDRGLEAVEADRGWPRHTARLLLAGALDQLSIHYGLTLCPRPMNGDILRWGDGRHQPARRT